MERTALLVLALLGLFIPFRASADCNVCHSKKPEMRRMHEALEYKDCFSCHGPSAKTMDNAKRAEDLRCVACHKS